MQDLQLELERKELRPVTVHEWAVAAGHPSAHQLMAALQEGRKAERTMLLCHQGLVRSVAFRCVARVVWWLGLKAACRIMDRVRYIGATGVTAVLLATWLVHALCFWYQYYISTIVLLVPRIIPRINSTTAMIVVGGEGLTHQ